jgi:membrane protease YdiL (CAAX protease family)
MSEPIPPRPDLLHPLAGAPAAPEPDARPRSTWTWYEAIGVYLLALFLGGFAALPVFQAISSEDLADVVASLLVSVVIVGALLIWLQRFHPTWRRVIRFPERIWPEIRAGIGFGLLLYPAIVFVVGIVVTEILQAVSGKHVHAPEQVGTELSGIGVAITAVYAIVVAPAGEELFFRGILFRTIRDRHGFAAGAIASGFAFGLVHYVPSAWQDSVLLMSVMVFTGIALAWIHERRGNLLANIAAHATFNAVGLVLIFALR